MKIEIDKTVDRYNQGDIFHEAGFDALITGKVFLQLGNYLTKEIRVDKILAHEVIANEINKIPYMLLENSYMNLNGEDRFPQKNNVFFIKDVSEDDTNKVNSYFNSYGKIKIQKKNDCSVFLIFTEPDKLTKEVRDVLLSKGHPYTILSFDQFTRIKILETERKKPVPIIPPDHVNNVIKAKKDIHSYKPMDYTYSNTDDEMEEEDPVEPSTRAKKRKIVEITNYEEDNTEELVQRPPKKRRTLRVPKRLTGFCNIL